jgi:hypothetical protein
MNSIFSANWSNPFDNERNNIAYSQRAVDRDFCTCMECIDVCAVLLSKHILQGWSQSPVPMENQTELARWL